MHNKGDKSIEYWNIIRKYTSTFQWPTHNTFILLPCSTVIIPLTGKSNRDFDLILLGKKKGMNKNIQYILQKHANNILIFLFILTASWAAESPKEHPSGDPPVLPS